MFVKQGGCWKQNYQIRAPISIMIAIMVNTLLWIYKTGISVTHSIQLRKADEEAMKSLYKLKQLAWLY